MEIRDTAPGLQSALGEHNAENYADAIDTDHITAPYDEPAAVEHRTLPCDSYFTTNDLWHPQTVYELRTRMRSMAADPETSAALVVGAGTLPYTLDVLPPTIITADLDPKVVASVIGRCNLLASDAESWEGYIDAALLAYPDAYINTEFRNLEHVELVADFESAQSAARRVQLIPLIGNIVTELTKAMRHPAMEGKEFTFINFTNVAQYLSGPRGPHHTEGIAYNGRSVLAALLERLPVHDDAIICDSTSAQTPELFWPAKYIEENPYYGPK